MSVYFKSNPILLFVRKQLGVLSPKLTEETSHSRMNYGELLVCKVNLRLMNSTPDNTAFKMIAHFYG